MALPGIFRRLFANGGAGATLRGEIIPYGTAARTVYRGNDTRVVNAVPTSLPPIRAMAGCSWWSANLE